MAACVSIIIPCYNGEDVIDQSIESVFKQKYTDVELIVVDDGSTDDSKKKINDWKQSFADKGWTLRYVYQQNRGLGGAIDTGLKYVTGKYLSLLDADDYFLEDSIKKKAAFLDKHLECVGVRSNGWEVNRGQKRLFITNDKEKSITDLFSALIYGTTNNWAGTYMIRTDILFEFYPDRSIFPSRFGQNMQILLPVAYKRKFGYIDEPLMVYVLHDSSHSQADDPTKQFEKEMHNIEGYREIYLHMLDVIVEDTDERSTYRRIFDAAHARSTLYRAIQYGKGEAAKKNYQILCELGSASINDRIAYASFKKSPMAVVLRIIRKCKAICHRAAAEQE